MRKIISESCWSWMGGGGGGGHNHTKPSFLNTQPEYLNINTYVPNLLSPSIIEKQREGFFQIKPPSPPSGRGGGRGGRPGKPHSPSRY